MDPLGNLFGIPKSGLTRALRVQGCEKILKGFITPIRVHVPLLRVPYKGSVRFGVSESMYPKAS